MLTLTRLRSHVALPVALLGLLVATLVVGLAASPADASTWRHRHLKHARHIALDQIGDRYAYGADGPRRFDCSGLVYYSYRKAGFRHVPRTSDAQAHHARRIRKKNLRPGDFMYFADRGGVYHVAVFLRWRHHHAVMLHAPGEGERVRRDRPWTRHWYAGTLRGL